MILTRMMGLAMVAALAFGQSAFAAGPSSANYAITSSTMNAGVGDMASVNYKLSSSLGDPFFTSPMTSTSYQINPGFWGSVVGPLPLCLLDIDGDGQILPESDGLMILRAMFGMTGTAVTNGAALQTAPRKTWAEIQPYIHLNALDIDGNGSTQALTDGLLILRAMFGLTGSSVTTGVLGSNPGRGDWTAIRTYLNTSCGASFQL